MILLSLQEKIKGVLYPLHSDADPSVFCGVNRMFIILRVAEVQDYSGLRNIVTDTKGYQDGDSLAMGTTSPFRGLRCGHADTTVTRQYRYERYELDISNNQRSHGHLQYRTLCRTLFFFFACYCMGIRQITIRRFDLIPLIFFPCCAFCVHRRTCVLPVRGLPSTNWHLW